MTERLPCAGTAVRVPVNGGHRALELPARKAEIRAWLPSAAFRQRTEVWCAGTGSPPGAARHVGVRKVSMVAASILRLAKVVTAERDAKYLPWLDIIDDDTNGC